MRNHKCDTYIGLKNLSKKSRWQEMRATSTYEQAKMAAHVQCSGASTHQAQPLCTTFPLPTAPQPQMTNEDAQHMNHDRCFYILSLLLMQPLRIEPLHTNCALLHYVHIARPCNCRQIPRVSPSAARRTAFQVRCAARSGQAYLGRQFHGGRPAPLSTSVVYYVQLLL